MYQDGDTNIKGSPEILNIFLSITIPAFFTILKLFMKTRWNWSNPVTTNDACGCNQSESLWKKVVVEV